MAAKIPIRTVYVDSVATGLSEFQSGEFVDYSYGGTGLSALGSAGQVLKINSGASAMEWGAVEALLNIDGMTDGSAITIADADKFAISDGGTEKYVIASQLATYINAEIADDTVTMTNKTLTSAVLNSTISGTSIKDEDDLTSDSASHLATQQSIKAYVDAVQGANITEQNQFMQNPTNVTTTQTSTIAATQYAWLMGPITVNSGVTWTIVGTIKFIS